MENGVTHIILDLFLVLAAARLAGELFERLRQPAVLGEIAAGIVLGPLLLGWLETTELLTALAEVGVIFLLFTVGLHTRVSDVTRVGQTAIAVGVLGAIVPLALGWAIMALLGSATLESVFVGVAMMATSVGITARVLADLGVLSRQASQVIIGAAVIDDIVGLLALAVLSGLVEGGVSYLALAITAAEAIAFVAFVMLVGRRAAERFCAVAQKMWTRNPSFIGPILVCLGLSFLAEYVGLAAIIGAFLAGMVFAETERCVKLHDAVEPLYDLFVPFFFVMIGVRVTPGAVTESVALIALVITAAAILSKLLACRYAARGLASREAWIVGVGMSPRGEVGLVVASIGLTRGVIGPDIYAVVVLMSLLTTFFAPPVLRRLTGTRRPAAAPTPEAPHAPPW
jgi:Kef-type K+ transport system membrane component KefB